MNVSSFEVSRPASALSLLRSAYPRATLSRARDASRSSADMTPSVCDSEGKHMRRKWQ